MSKIPIANQTIMNLDPYRPGTPIAEVARQYNIPESSISKLASNENPRGPGEAALAAISAAAQTIRLYPDTYDFLATIAAHHHVEPEQIILGNGSNDVLDIIARAFLGPQTETIIYEYSFLVYKLVSTAVGATVIETKARHFGYDLEALQQAVTEKTRVIWIDNPNNPTGTFIEHHRLKAFLSLIPQSVLVVLDEAYWDYLPDHLRTDTMRWIEEFPNLIIVRTFSKLHGLAALRIGYGIGNTSLIEPLNRIRQPFNVNSLALAGASASLQATQHLETERHENERLLDMFCHELDHRNVSYIPSRGNFVTIRCEDSAATHQQLMKKGIITRPISNYGLDEYLRVTIGTEQDMTRFIAFLDQ